MELKVKHPEVALNERPHLKKVGLFRNITLATALALTTMFPKYSSQAQTSNPTETISANSNINGLSLLESELAELKREYDITVQGRAELNLIDNLDQHNENNKYRVTDTPNKGFNLTDVAIAVSKNSDNPTSFGFGLELHGGKEARVIHTFENRLNNNLGPDIPFKNLDIDQAFITYNLPLGNGIHLDLGRQFSLIGRQGEEVLINWGGLRYTQSIGLLPPLTPAFTSGVRVKYAFNDKISSVFEFSNGWDNFIITNRNFLRTVGVKLTVKPIKDFSLDIESMYGRAKIDKAGRKIWILDIVPKYNLSEKTVIMGEFIYSHQDGPISISIAHAINEKGIGLWIVRTMPDIYLIKDSRIAFRAEWVQDSRGAHTGISQNLFEGTVAYTCPITHNIYTRLEFRHDGSTAKPFESSSGKKVGDQDTVELGLILRF